MEIIGRTENTVVTVHLRMSCSIYQFLSVIVELVVHWGPSSWLNLLNSSVAVSIRLRGVKTKEKMWQVSVGKRGKRSYVLRLCHSVPRYNSLTF